MFPDPILHHRAVCGERFQRRTMGLPHEAGIPDHVRVQDRSELSSGRGVSGGCGAALHCFTGFEKDEGTLRFQMRRVND